MMKFQLKHICALLVLLQVMFIHASIVQAQDITEELSEELMNQSNIKGPLEFEGTVKELSKKLKGSIVTLYESPDGSHESLTEVFKTSTPGDGKFSFKLEINKFYVLSVEKSGYTTKKVDFDTDVTMAREQYTKVPKFEFEVDMVKDLDGLDFVGSVASVFYQIKTNEFDYQLDYSKEEMEDEERELRERKEKERLAQLAYEKKKALEEAAKLLLDKENATAQQLISAAITVGDGDKEKTIKGFMDVFPEVDTLREEKAAVMYDKYQEERKASASSGNPINFQSIFDAAKLYEKEIESVAQEKREKQIAELREEKELAIAKEKEAMAIQQDALELEAKEKLASAIAQEELKRQKEEKEKRDNIYYAIFNSNGDSETAIANLVKTYPKGDDYAEEKAKAIYAEYEKRRLGGTTLSNMDFNKLFEAADIAEQAAIKAEIERDNEKQNARLEAFMDKVEEKKLEEQKKTIDKIEDGLGKVSSNDETTRLQVFVDALPANENYKEAKAAAMFEQYKAQQEAISKIKAALPNTPKTPAAQKALFFNSLPSDMSNRKEVADKMYESFVATMVFQKQSSPTAQKQEEQLIASVLPGTVQNKEQVASDVYKKVVAASANNPTRKSQIAAIAQSLPASVQNREEVAEQVYEQYAKKKQAQGGSGTVMLDFASLFQAAETAGEKAQEIEKIEIAKKKQAEQDEIERKRKEARDQKREIAAKVEKDVVQVRQAEFAKAKSKKERELAEAIEKGAGDREKTVEGIIKALPQTNDKDLDRTRAEAVYDAYLEESAKIERSGNIGQKVDFASLFAAADKAELERLEKQFQAKQAERELEIAAYEEERIEKATQVAEKKQKEAEQLALAAEKQYEETLMKTEAQRQERLAEQQREKEELEKQIAMENARRSAEEKARAEEELAKVEAERNERLERERKEAERLAAIEAAEKLKQEEEARKAAEERLVMLEKEREAAEKAERERMEAEAAAKRKAELAAAKAEQERLERERKEAELLAKQDKERKEAEEKAAREAELAAAKAAEEARKAEQKRIEAEEKAAREAEMAAAKAAEEARLAEQKRIEEERKEAERLALEEQKRKEAEEKAAREAEIAAAKAAEAARIAEEKRIEEERKEAERLAAEEKKRQEQLALEQAQEAERKKREQFESLVKQADEAIARKDFAAGAKAYDDALALYPNESAVSKKLNDANTQIAQLAKEEEERLALEKKFNDLVTEAEKQLAENNYEIAKSKYEQALRLQPNNSDVKQAVRNVERTQERLLAEEKARQETERKYALLIQEGNRALDNRNVELARTKFTEAKELKPDEAQTTERLEKVQELADQIALEVEKERERKEEAKRKYEEQQALAAAQAEEQAAKREAERIARMKALGVIADEKAQQSLTAQEQEEARKAAYEKLKEDLAQRNMTAEEQRKVFLSELAQIYPDGLTKETVQGKNFVLTRYVIKNSGVVSIYEKKTWDWGGVFFFKDSDIAITEAIYKLEIGKYE